MPLIDLLQPRSRSLGGISDPFSHLRSDPQALRAFLTARLLEGGRQPAEVQQMTPEQMEMILRQLKGADTIGVRG